MNDAAAVIEDEPVNDEVTTDTTSDEVVEDRGDLIPSPEEDGDETAKTTPEEDEAEVAAANDEDPVTKEEASTTEVKPDIQIPKHRLDGEIARRKAYQNEAESLRQQLADKQAAEEESVPDYDFSAKTKEEYDAILEGDTEKAATIRAEIDGQRMAVVQQKILDTAVNTSEVTQEDIVFKNTVAELTMEYPTFNPEHNDYNEDLLQEVLFKRDAYANAGMSRADSLSIATKEVALLNGVHGLSDRSERAPAPGSGSDEVDTATAKARIKAKLDDSQSQAPDMPGEASDSRGAGKLDVSTMSDEEFNALPESTLKRLRGD